ncbi:MAG: hypothetical protein CL946_05745 [Ectothiorhodospiraceae bacterium]|nr:hypothetical protein [Ectothiorhodospiraceae bacterium]
MASPQNPQPNSKKSNPASNAAPDNGRFELFAVFLLTAAVLASYILYTEPSEARWDVLYGYIGDWGSLILLAGLISGALAYALSFQKKFADSLSQSLGPKPKTPLWYYGIGIAVTALFAWATVEYKVGFAFLGDGAIYLGEVYRILVQEAYESTLAKPTAWLNGHAIIALANSFDFNNAQTPFQVLSTVCAIVFGIGLFAGLRHEQPKYALIFILLFFVSAGSLLFFGYVELYVLGYTFAVLYFVAAWNVVRSRTVIWVPGIFLAIAVLASASSAVFIPSYLLLLHWKKFGEGGQPNFKHSAVILSLLPVIAVIASYVILGGGQGNTYAIPLIPYEDFQNGVFFGWQSYVLFNVQHMLDVIAMYHLHNVLIFIAALKFLMIDIRKLPKSDPLTLVAVAALAGGFTLVLTGNATFGMGRDWDLMAIPLLSASFFAAVMFVRLDETGKLSLAPKLPAIGIFAIVPLLLWVGVNHDEKASAKRFTQLVDLYEPYVTAPLTHNALENLRKYYLASKDFPNYLDILERMVENGYSSLDDAQEYLGALKVTAKDIAGEEEYRWLVASVDSIARTNTDSSRYDYIKPQLLEEFTTEVLITAMLNGYEAIAEAHIPQFKQHFGTWESFPIYQAMRIPEDRPMERMQVAEQAPMHLFKEVALMIRVGTMFKEAERYQEAAAMYELVLRENPYEYRNIYIRLAQIYYDQLRNRDAALDVLQRCIKNCPGTPTAEQAQKIIDNVIMPNSR